MNIYFVTSNNPESNLSGGCLESRKIFHLLCTYGSVDTLVIKKRSTFRSIISLTQGYFPPLDKQYVRDFIKNLIEKKYDFVFFEDSISGSLIKIAKGMGLLVINKFNNCEFDYNDVRFGKKRGLKWYVYKKLAYREEKLTTKLSDYMIALSKRDADRIQALYKRRPDALLPLTLVDTYKQKKNNIEYSDFGCVLFGPAEEANIEGFGWFVKNVSPYLNCKTFVCGKGFESFKDKWGSEKVQVIGFVHELEGVYDRALCVVIPLFSGGGMKVKTAEALMYGKYIYGTDEAFSGYELDYNKVGGLCNTSEEFIKSINDLHKEIIESGFDVFNSYSRKTYENQYSLESSKRIMDKILKELKLLQE